MSRSRRKTPIIGNCAGTEKYDKRMNNRRLRKKTRQALREDSDVLPIMRDVSDIWSMNKDGKHYLDPALHNSKWVRK